MAMSTGIIAKDEQLVRRYAHLLLMIDQYDGVQRADPQTGAMRSAR